MENSVVVGVAAVIFYYWYLKIKQFVFYWKVKHGPK